MYIGEALLTILLLFVPLGMIYFGILSWKLGTKIGDLLFNKYEKVALNKTNKANLNKT